MIHTAGLHSAPFLAETDSKLCDVFILFVPQTCLIVFFLDLLEGIFTGFCHLVVLFHNLKFQNCGVMPSGTLLYYQIKPPVAGFPVGNYHIAVKSGNKPGHEAMIIVLLFIETADRVGQPSTKQVFQFFRICMNHRFQNICPAVTIDMVDKPRTNGVLVDALDLHFRRRFWNRKINHVFFFEGTICRR